MARKIKKNDAELQNVNSVDFSGEKNIEVETVKSEIVDETKIDNEASVQIETQIVVEETEKLDNDDESKENNEIESEEIEIKKIEEEVISENQEQIQDMKNSEIVSENEKELGLSKEIVDEKLKQALNTQNPKKRKKSVIINLIFMLINVIFMVFIVKNLIADVDGMSFGEIIRQQGDKLWWLAGGLLFYIIYIIAQVLMYKALIKNLTGKSRWGLSYDVAVVGKYYDNVTPFAVGGQPMQIVRLAESGISPGISTSIPIIKMLINNAINVLVAVIFFIFGLPKLPLLNAFTNFLQIIIIILGVIGIIISVILVVFMFLISSGSLFTRSFVSGLLRLGYKLKIVKNYRKSFKKVINQLSEYKSSMSYLWKHKKLLIKIIVLSLVECLTYASMPIFMVLAFSGNIDMSMSMLILICLTKHYVCSMASSFIPLPGGTGLMEISFIFLFGITIGDYVVWALLAWRFFTYYLIILHGFVHELRIIVTKLVKNSKKRKVT